ncbi:MAG: hypothetical protein K0R00_932 [Herbinix sp.]|jgi:hypothetical protein|nr:hypothetical protein [Herbinix sp.]
MDASLKKLDKKTDYDVSSHSQQNRLSKLLNVNFKRKIF